MVNLKISAFADEYADSAEEQLQALKQFGIGHIEVRHLNGKNLSVLSRKEVNDAKKAFDNLGIKVSAIGSPLGKIKLDGSMEDHLETARRVFEYANVLETRFVRMFSFYAPDGKSIVDMKDEVLIIYSEAPEEISGLLINVSTDLYFCVRYLDSDSYAMLGYSWADDVGMLSSGDEEAYYTEEEKEAQAREEEERIAEYNRIYQMLEGVWEDAEGTCRVEVWESGPEDNYKRYITLYRMEDGEWVQDMIMYAKTLWAWDTENGVSVEVTEGSYGYRLGFDLYYDMDDDLTVMESDHFMGVMLQRVE